MLTSSVSCSKGTIANRGFDSHSLRHLREFARQTAISCDFVKGNAREIEASADTYVQAQRGHPSCVGHDHPLSCLLDRMNRPP